MRGVRKRLRQEAESRIRQAHMTAVFHALTQTQGGLKPVDHYLGGEPKKMSGADMHEAFRRMAAAGVPVTLRRVH